MVQQSQDVLWTIAEGPRLGAIIDTFGWNCGASTDHFLQLSNSLVVTNLREQVYVYLFEHNAVSLYIPYSTRLYKAPHGLSCVPLWLGQAPMVPLKDHVFSAAQITCLSCELNSVLF